MPGLISVYSNFALSKRFNRYSKIEGWDMSRPRLTHVLSFDLVMR